MFLYLCRLLSLLPESVAKSFPRTLCPTPISAHSEQHCRYLYHHVGYDSETTTSQAGVVGSLSRQHQDKHSELDMLFIWWEVGFPGNINGSTSKFCDV